MKTQTQTDKATARSLSIESICDLKSLNLADALSDEAVDTGNDIRRCLILRAADEIREQVKEIRSKQAEHAALVAVAEAAEKLLGAFSYRISAVTESRELNSAIAALAAVQKGAKS